MINSQKSIVGIKKINDFQNEMKIKETIFNILDTLKNRGQIKIPKNAEIMIKTNICLVKCSKSGTTVDPFIIISLVDWLLLNFNIKKIFIGEADATQLNIDIAFKALGWEKAFENYENVELLNLSKDELSEVDINGLFFNKLKMSKKYIESDYLISVGKLKTHTVTKITCVLKNQFGSNPVKYKAQYHSNLDKVICDLNEIKVPDLCLVDGIIAMEGEGPVSGIPKPMGLIIAGNDPVSTDYVCANIMGFNPKKISHIQLALKKGLGKDEYEIFGENIANLKEKFKLIPFWKKLISNIYKKSRYISSLRQ